MYFNLIVTFFTSLTIFYPVKGGQYDSTNTQPPTAPVIRPVSPEFPTQAPVTPPGSLPPIPIPPGEIFPESPIPEPPGSLPPVPIPGSESAHAKDPAAHVNPDVNVTDLVSSDHYPYLVSIAVRKNQSESNVLPTHVCSGALVNMNIVISAASCFRDFENVKYNVLPNVRNASLATLEDRIYDVKNVYTTFQSKSESASDLAIVSLDESIPIWVDGLTIVKLAGTGTQYPPGTRFKVAGYAKTETGEMQESELVRNDDKSCAAADPRFVPEAMICGSNQRNTNSCSLDAGSLLILPGPTPTLVGVMGNVEGNCGPSKALNFVRLEFYKDWIIEQLHKIVYSRPSKNI